MNKQRIQTFLIRARNGLAYLLRGDVRAFVGRWRALRRERGMAQHFEVLPDTILPGTILSWCVMATPHTKFIAQLIAKRLKQHGWSVTVVIGEPERFDAHFYVVVCPQMCNRLPPPERRFVYQMEQSVSSRWFTNDYLDILRNS